MFTLEVTHERPPKTPCQIHYFPTRMVQTKGKIRQNSCHMDPKYSDTAKMSDIWVGFEENGDYGFYNAIRAVLKGKELKKDVISGIPKEDIIELTEAMKNVEFGALFFGLGLTHTLSKQRNIDIAIQIFRTSMSTQNGYFFL